MILKDTDERSTPIELFKELDDEFHFEIDVCAFSWNTKCSKYFSPSDDALKQSWKELRCFMNPPYSDIPKWLSYAKKQETLVVCILPMDSSTKWFHEFIWDKDLRQFRIPVILPDKRYKFGDNVNSAKFASLIAIFGWLKSGE